MKTRNLIKTILLAVCLAAVSLPSMANSGKTVKEVTPEAQARGEQIMKRLEEIKAMDTKDMTSAQKRALKHEVRAMKKESANVGGGVYISVGALLIIILILILIL